MCGNLLHWSKHLAMVWVAPNGLIRPKLCWVFFEGVCVWMWSCIAMFHVL